MLESLALSFDHLTLDVLLALLIGVIAGTIVGVIPGIGGLFVLALLLPFTYTMDMYAAFALLLSAAAVVATSNTVTSVLFGVPGTAGGVAVTFDGHPMAKRGEADRAMAAAFVSSSLAGIFGVVVVVALLPVFRSIVVWFGPPEYFILVLIAVVLMAFSVREHKMRALIAGGLGLLVSLVGMDYTTGTPRYTFDYVYLWDGVQIVPAIIGLFALTEMLVLLRKNIQAKKSSVKAASSWKGTMRGIRDVFIHWKVGLQSSLIGVGVGGLPGVGGETAQFLSYSQAQRTSKYGDRFGTGEVSGVIAADASSSSKDASSLVPTLLFGVPGSAQMALLLAAFLIFGVVPGPAMVDEQLDVTLFLLMILVIAHVSASILCLLLAGTFMRLVSLKPVYIATVVIVLASFGTYASTNHIGDVVTALVAGAVGYAMVSLNYSRATFIVGLVLGPVLQENLNLSISIHGATMLGRPAVITLILLAVVGMVWPKLRSLVKKGTRADKRV